MSPDELLAHIDQQLPVTIVDVRDEDRAEGWIPHSLHIPSHGMTAAHLKQVAETTAHLVVFHCMFSQVRGPRACRWFNEIASQMGRAPAVILDGGFGAWARMAMRFPERRLVELP